MADSLLRATGGYTALFRIPAAVGDSTDAAQLGLNIPTYQDLSVAPVTFRRTRPVVAENQRTKYELLVSASAVADQVTLLDLVSADALFSLVASVNVSGMILLVEEWASSVSLGEPIMYRMLLREAEPQPALQEGKGA
ncbi:hypothetical protein [Acidipila sp. EB88]|uniref:hypothetical protein n=1 Tax=Acidipila sp. EB88 TaxID=2305226 RepID=UPI000F5D6D0A|nr:hypothetical protein [Acidipila sp. EB88]RRA48221.1 hypothetical protein D1Y84_07900 [Acidipila sp. EB88]